MEAGIYSFSQTQKIAQARLIFSRHLIKIDLMVRHPAIPTPRLFRPTRNRAYRAGAGRAQGRWHSNHLARQKLSTRDAKLCLVAWLAYLNDIRGFPRRCVLSAIGEII